MAIWNIIEIFRDKCLLSRVRAELTAAEFQGIASSQDVEKLLSLPLMQSIYAELLRLRIEVQMVFSSDREDIRINEWRFPKKSLVMIPAGAAHRDPDFWNTKNGEYPTDRFWADRFLAHPDDPWSGPHRDYVTDRDKSEETKKTGSDFKKAKFVSSGLANSFMPWGIGERTCPGRGLARREIVAICAMVVDRFDIEITPTDASFELSPAFYGIGTQRPLKGISFKVRKRKV